MSSRFWLTSLEVRVTKCFTIYSLLQHTRLRELERKINSVCSIHFKRIEIRTEIWSETLKERENSGNIAAELTKLKPVSKKYVRKVFRWPRGLTRGSAAACLLGLWVRIPPRAWIFVSYECLTLSKYRHLRRANLSSRGVTPSVCAFVSVCVCVTECGHTQK
jgi:hypothetical protein